MITKSPKGWKVDTQPTGRGGKRFRKTFKLKVEAQQWEAWIKNQVNQTTEWQPEKRDLRKITDLVTIWFEHHGSGLRAGHDMKRRLEAMARSMGNPVADRFNVESFAKYRKERIEQGLTPNNMNREHAYLRAMFNELIRLGQWKKENPLKVLRAFKIQEQELTYLNNTQIKKLFQGFRGSRNPHVQLIAEICLSTGARWGEAEGLKKTQVRNGMIEFARTKSGKTRAVPINKKLEQKIVAHGIEQRESERLFTHSITAFREAVDRAGLKLPAGQKTHVLRHTFASHFMMNGGNILTLQRVLGHANLTMTMRYAHLAPEHLQEVIALNPLAGLTLG